MTTPTYENRSCPACSSLSSSEHIHSDRRAEDMPLEELRPFWSGFFKEKVFFSYNRCNQCGFLFAPVFFNEQQLADLYSEMEPNMDLVPTDALEATQRGYFDVAAGTGALKGGYLEIGPDVGYIVNHAAREGQFDHFWLFEPNRAVHQRLAEATEGKPHSVLADMTDLSCVPDHSVGLAVMVHVLDHLLDPMAMLLQIRQKLRPDGTLMIVTHNEKSLLRTVMDKRWPPFCLQHPVIYNPQSIAGIMKRAAFGKVSVRRSKNYFPIDFMVRQAAWTIGVKLDKVPLPKWAVGWKLGNIITLASR